MTTNYLESAKARLIAFYLPQFHPIPENDQAWGKGFTEWTNVAKAKPLFPGHHQPKIPADLGFYDLRLPEARQAQADLAREYGIEGFCYWHYWLAKAKVPEETLEQKSNEPQFIEAVGAKKEAQTHARQAPQTYRQGEKATINKAEEPWRDRSLRRMAF